MIIPTKDIFLTGIIDIDLIILFFLDDNSIFNSCLVNKYALSLFDNDNLWRIKITNSYLEADKYKNKDKKWKEYYIELSETDCDINHAAAEGYIDIFEWLSKKNNISTIKCANLASSYGNINILEWLISEKNILPNIEGYNYAVGNGHVNVLEWLKKRNILIISDDIIGGINKAKVIGKIKVLEWLSNIRKEKNIQPWNLNIDIYEWFRRRKISPNIDGANFLAENGYIDILEWLEKEKEILPTIKGANLALNNGNIKILEWLVKRGILLDKKNIKGIKRRRNKKLFEWLKEKGLIIKYIIKK